MSQLKIDKKCSCGNVTSIIVDSDAYNKWQDGMRIQDAMPKMSPMEREVLITGMCFDCQSKLYNIPVPGHEKKWGKEMHECFCCECRLWEKDKREDGKLVCPSCKEVQDVEDDEEAV